MRRMSCNAIHAFMRIIRSIIRGFLQENYLGIIFAANYPQSTFCE